MTLSPLYQPHLTSWSRGPCPFVCLISETFSGITLLNAMKILVYWNIQITNSHSPRHPFFWTAQGQFLSCLNCILSTQSNTCHRTALGEQVSTGWLAWAVEVGAKNLLYLISTTAKVHSCQALKLQGQSWKGSWWRLQYSLRLILNLWPFPLSLLLNGVPSGIFHGHQCS